MKSAVLGHRQFSLRSVENHPLPVIPAKSLP
jgi:hypothetical protein